MPSGLQRALWGGAPLALGESKASWGLPLLASLHSDVVKGFFVCLSVCVALSLLVFFRALCYQLVPGFPLSLLREVLRSE